MKKHSVMFLTLFFSAFYVFASESKLLTIEGKIRSFDKDVVRVTTSKGVVAIPRKFIPHKLQLKTDATIKIPLSEEQLSSVK